MQDSLSLQIHLDDDGTAELSAQVQANGFGGHGSAWIDPLELKSIASTLAEAFPLKEALCIRGGYWSGANPATLTQEHLAISFYPVDGRGIVGCQVRLAAPSDREDRESRKYSIQAELLTSYEELRRFAKSVTLLSTGEAQEAVLNGTAV
jgi:hypothetical protein